VVFIPCQSIESAIGALRSLRSLEIGEESFIANPQYLSLMLSGGSLEAYRKTRNNLSPWTVGVVISGQEGKAAYQEEDLKDLAVKNKYELISELPGIPDAGEKILEEISYPHGNDNQKIYKGACNPVFTYVLPKQAGSMLDMVNRIADNYGYSRQDIGYFFLPLDYARGYYFEPSFHRNPQDEAETEKVHRIFHEVSEKLFEAGAVFDRPYGAWAEMVFNNAGKYHKKIKDIKHLIDPENIMNPGKLAFY
jgi:FAD/FMN-containing dehydrogenase